MQTVQKDSNPAIEEKIYKAPAPKPVYDVCKRIFDIVMSIFALIVLSPVFLATAIAIKIEDGGPVFFRQVRLTKGGKDDIAASAKKVMEKVHGSK